MLTAQMIAKAWTDEAYLAALTAQGLKVPPKPDDLGVDQLEVLTRDQENREVAPVSPFS